jgi:predicted O-methyltransferase YrrM
MSTKTFTLSPELHDYLLAHSLRDHPRLSALREETAKMPQGRMQISPEQGQLMQVLVQAIGARRCLEVGVFTGYSSMAVAMALPADGSILACDVSEDFTAVARRHWKEAGVAAKIDLRIAPALETLDALVAVGKSGTFDFAFIDADKGNYAGYHERALKLLRVGGLAAYDNTLWSGRVADPANTEADTVALRAFNDLLHRDERIALSMVPIGDGLTLAVKRKAS